MVSTLHYVPVKGIYDEDDYTDHGSKRSLGRIYGIVPETNNFAWETFLDEDGVERTYACTDVLLFTALYKEANEIIGKSLSMELFEPSIKYHFEVIESQKWCVFDEGCFLGLQVLGDNVEPCFEGAAFYELQDSISTIVEKIKQYALDYEQNQGEKDKMPKLNFKLSDSEKFDAIWSLLNTEYDEEHNWTITYGIINIYDDYALVCKYEDNSYARVKYTKDDETNSVALGDVETVYIIDVTAHEKEAVETLRALNGGTYELVSDVLNDAQTNFERISEFETKITEMEVSLSTLNTEKDEIESKYNDATAQYTAAQSTIEQLNHEVENLNTYKHNIEVEQKETIFTEYAAQLSEDVINKYRADMDKYTVLELDMRLAYELKCSNPNIFSNQNSNPFIPKDAPKTGIESVLDRFKK